MDTLSSLWEFFTGKPPPQRPSIFPPPGFEMPPLITAVMARDTTAVRDLLVNGADIHVVDDLGCNALHCAVLGENVEMVELLLEHGADVHIRAFPERVRSVLAMAIASDDEKISKILMARDATIEPDELTEPGMASYIRWMSDEQLKAYKADLLSGPFRG